MTQSALARERSRAPDLLAAATCAGSIACRCVVDPCSSLPLRLPGSRLLLPHRLAQVGKMHFGYILGWMVVGGMLLW